MYINDRISERALPELLKFVDGREVNAENAGERRAEMLGILQREIYGKMPERPDYVKGEVISDAKTRDCAGKARIKNVRVAFGIKGEEFSFPVWVVMPKKKKPPFAIIINFRSTLPDEYIPCEELVDRGLGFAVVNYKDVTSDDGNMSDGFAGVLAKLGYNHTGKIAMWAYAVSVSLDYVLETEDIDRERIAVAGHSRLGKTALVAAAFDERFTCAFSNNSGCSGAAITRGKRGENVDFITKTFGYWFCNRYKNYANKHSELPFDQHFLLACIAPRKVYVASALEDTWSDPESEYLCCAAAGEYWKLYGKAGFICNRERMVNISEVFHEGNIGYHLRSGVHFLSREDWNKFLDYFLK